MSEYPPVVAAIVADYLERVRARMPRSHLPEREDLVRELQSHIYEAFQRAPAGDDVPRILSVLRGLGEPADLVSDRLPESLVRSGRIHFAPMRVLGGLLIAALGIPLGVGGVGALSGVLLALAAVVAAYYATAGAVLLCGAVFLVLGLTRLYNPGLWDRLVQAGLISVDSRLIDSLSPSAQGVVIFSCAAVFVALGVAMVWGGTYLVRGLRLLFGLALDGLRRLAHDLRARLKG
jgi:hypothetical protein